MNDLKRETVELQGAPNFRSLGGYRNTEGRVLRPGLVYRSDSLSYLTDSDLDTLRELAIGLVIDVRSTHEQTRQLSRWPHGYTPRTLSYDINVDLRANNQPLISVLRANPNVEGAREMLRTAYRMMPRAFFGHLDGIFHELAREDCPPAVLHCTVGKDRTGFITAMLLFALGMPREAVYEDYLLTAQRMRNPYLAKFFAENVRKELRREFDPSVVDTLLGVEAEYLDAALLQIEEEYGSVERYLAVAGRLDESARRRLQTRLLA